MLIFALSPWEIISILLLWLVLLIASVFLVLKYEQGYTKFIWLAGVLFLPIIGSLLAIIANNFINKRVGVSL